MFSRIVFCNHVIAAVWFELEMVACGFALLFAFVQACPRSDSPALLFTYFKKTSFFFLVLHDYCMIFAANTVHFKETAVEYILTSWIMVILDIAIAAKMILSSIFDVSAII